MHQRRFADAVFSQKSIYTVSYFQRYVVENKWIGLVSVACVLYRYHNFISVVLMYNTANVGQVMEKSKGKRYLLTSFSGCALAVCLQHLHQYVPYSHHVAG